VESRKKTIENPEVNVDYIFQVVQQENSFSPSGSGPSSALTKVKKSVYVGEDRMRRLSRAMNGKAEWGKLRFPRLNLTTTGNYS